MTNDHSRRGFLAAAGVGAAGVASAAVLGGAGSADAATPAGNAAATTVPKEATEPLVAYVRDAHTGEVAVMVGEREVVVHDRELAARIARAAYGGK